MAITNYSQYLKQLKLIYQQYGCNVSDAVLRKLIVTENLGRQFGVTLSSARETLMIMHQKAMAPAPDPTAVVSAKHPVVINSYGKYLLALEGLYLSLGAIMPDSAMIQSFIQSHDLDTRFHITEADVKKDLQTIRNRHGGASNPKLFTYEQYMRALKALFDQNGGVLTDEQLANFINSNGLDLGFNITLDDVRKDLLTFGKKQPPVSKTTITSYDCYKQALNDVLASKGDQAFLDGSIKQFLVVHGMDAHEPDAIVHVRMDLALIQAQYLPISPMAIGFMEKDPVLSMDPQLAAE